MKKINIVKRQMAHKKQWKFSSLRLKLLLWFLWQEPIYQKIKLIQPFTSLSDSLLCFIKTYPASFVSKYPIISFESTFKERRLKILLSYYTSNVILLLFQHHSRTSLTSLQTSRSIRTYLSTPQSTETKGSRPSKAKVKPTERVKLQLSQSHFFLSLSSSFPNNVVWQFQLTYMDIMVKDMI